MAASDQTIVDNARDALNRILQTDSSSWSEAQRTQSMLEIDRLSDIIDRFERKANAAGGRRQIFHPVKRIDL
jgi:hypothetical protein